MTSDQALQFLNKIDTLPEELRFYFISDLFAVVSKEMSAQFGVTVDSLDQLLFVWVTNDFDLNILSKEMAQTVTNHEVADQLFIAWLGKIALPLDEYLQQDIAGILQDNNTKPENYQTYVDAFNVALDEYSADLLDNYVTELEQDLDPAEIKRDTYELLSSRLSEIMANDNARSIVAFNQGLVYLLNNEEDSRRAVESRVLENSEKLTSQAVIVDGRAVQPTIANWLRDFNNNVDLNNFNSLAIADYLVKNNNAKNLSEAEKQLLQILLQFYYNIKFYPDSMADKPITDWYVMPLRPELREDLLTEDLTEEEEETPVQSVVTPTDDYIAEASTPIVDTQQSSVLKMQKMAEQYPQGSLERLAIEEEIKKMK